MSLTLHLHPLSSFCWKTLIALYENGTPFTPNSVDLGNPAERDALLRLWPVGKFPVLRDDARDQTVPESSIIIEYLDRHYPGRTRFVPADPDLTWQTRLRDRFYDLYLHLPMQKVMGDRLRPSDKKDPHGVEEAKARLRASYGMIEAHMAGRLWAMGDFLWFGRLRRTALSVLRQHRAALRRCPSERHSLFGAPEGASLGRAGDAGGRAVFRHGAEISQRTER